MFVFQQYLFLSFIRTAILNVNAGIVCQITFKT